jgi:MFS family permease
MVMTTTMGLLSVLTTGWWGHFGERYGRVKVLALSTLGLVLTDLIFILVSSPGNPLSKYGHKLLLIAPITEGLMGGWSTLQSATSAYISDCTSPGSRSHIFSRFTGAFFIGICIGPSLGGIIIRSYSTGAHKSVIEVFWYAAAGSALNLLLCLFVLPESLSKQKQEKARIQYAKETSKKGKARDTSEEHDEEEHANVGVVGRFFSPLRMFLPAMVPDASGTKMKKDWSLTFLAAALFGYFLSTVSIIWFPPFISSIACLFHTIIRVYISSSTCMVATLSGGALIRSATMFPPWVARVLSSSCSFSQPLSGASSPRPNLQERERPRPE